MPFFQSSSERKIIFPVEICVIGKNWYQSILAFILVLTFNSIHIYPNLLIILSWFLDCECTSIIFYSFLLLDALQILHLSMLNTRKYSFEVLQRNESIITWDRKEICHNKLELYVSRCLHNVYGCIFLLCHGYLAFCLVRGMWKFFVIYFGVRICVHGKKWKMIS